MLCNFQKLIIIDDVIDNIIDKILFDFRRLVYVCILIWPSRVIIYFRWLKVGVLLHFQAGYIKVKRERTSENITRTH